MSRFSSNRSLRTLDIKRRLRILRGEGDLSIKDIDYYLEDLLNRNPDNPINYGFQVRGDSVVYELPVLNIEFNDLPASDPKRKKDVRRIEIYRFKKNHVASDCMDEKKYVLANQKQPTKLYIRDFQYSVINSEKPGIFDLK